MPDDRAALRAKIEEVLGPTVLKRLETMTAAEHVAYAEVAVNTSYDRRADLRARAARGEAIIVGADHEDYLMILAAAWLVLSNRLAAT